MTDVLARLTAHLAATPTPTPVPSVNPNDVTPGPIGFTAIALVGLAVVLLILDMVRRIRRVRYRAEIAEKLDAEQAAAEAAARGRTLPVPPAQPGRRELGDDSSQSHVD
jgi:hypothetical protein